MPPVVAFLSNVHGNLTALEEALAFLKRKGVTEIHVLGNLVGEGRAPNEVVALARKRGLQCLQGPFEAALAGRSPPPRLFPTETARERFEADVACNADTLESTHLRYLQGLPLERRLGAGGQTALAAAGRVGTPWKAFAMDAPVSAVRQELEMARADLVLLGTPGFPFVREEGTKRVVGTGSLHEPRHGEGRVTLLDLETGVVAQPVVAYPVP
ncbi:MAG TPA: metallophosphoesterase family protein [Candidatus Thermoplasmatota archaeon]|nr:metallophosphoesterase family protein [Candidatus Thermoplasmatota archaeon]